MYVEATELRGLPNRPRSPELVEKDRLLVQALNAGEPEATRTFLTDLYPRLHEFARRLLPSDADDLIQDTVIKTLTAFANGKYDPEKKAPQKYAFMIMRSLNIDHMRRSTTRKRTEELYVVTRGEDVHPSAEDDFATWEEQFELRDRLETAFRTLPEREGSYVIRNGLMEQPGWAIAEAEGIPVGTFKSRIRTAKQQLRQVLKEL